MNYYSKNTNNMNDLFVPYDIAIELKRLGFNERCFIFYDEYKIAQHILQLEAFWNNNDTIQYLRGFRYTFKRKKAMEIMCLAPTWDQVTKWFLTKNIHVTFTPIFVNEAIGSTKIDCYVPHCNSDDYGNEYPNPESAYIDAIFKGIEILKSKQNGI